MVGFTTAQLAAVAAAPIIGGIAHELTHAVAARLLGAETSASLLGFEVNFRFGDEAPTWKHRLVLLAPTLVGAVLGGVTLGDGASFGGFWLAALVGWIFYTISFSPADYSLAAARGEAWWYEQLEERNRVAIQSLVLTVSGFGLFLAVDVLPAYWKPGAFYGAWSLLIAGPMVLILGLNAAETPTRAGAT